MAVSRNALAGGMFGMAGQGLHRQNGSGVEDMLDVENKRMADSLASKVTRLKSLALDIDKDAEEQNRYLDGMDSDFMSVTGLLTGSVKRFSTMTRSGRDNRKLLCSVSAGLIVVFFILYYLGPRCLQHSLSLLLSSSSAICPFIAVFRELMVTESFNLVSLEMDEAALMKSPQESWGSNNSTVSADTSCSLQVLGAIT
ncbi:BET1-like protein isoform X2 [Aix galericulata]|nr:BET1-like protein isoform X2 [Aix galericulata]